MISILLAEAVLDQNGRISTVQDSGNDVTFYGKESEFLGTYNIYELAHKCKEWAIAKGFSIESRVITFNKALVAVWDIEKMNCATRLDELSTVFNTEPEAIFKACQWILDNKETK